MLPCIADQIEQRLPVETAHTLRRARVESYLDCHIDSLRTVAGRFCHPSQRRFEEDSVEFLQALHAFYVAATEARA